METQISEVAKLNDVYRKANPAHFTITRGVANRTDLSRVISMVRSFDDFNEDNDPHGEHDFGVITLDDEKLYWKIDYYTPELSGWCDPLDPACHRVLIVMLAEEY